MLQRRRRVRLPFIRAQQHDAAQLPVFIRFSVSKWIHLNAGDEGLETFFRRVHQVLKPDGTFILEPQEWDTYGKAKRMDPVRGLPG